MQQAPAPATSSSPEEGARLPSQRSHRGHSLELSIAYHRYLRWLLQLQRTADAASDDAYTLDRLMLQGVLPLRQRTATVATGMRAAVYELLIGAAVREGADVLKARQQMRAWKLLGGVTPPGRAGDAKAATYSHFSSAAQARGKADPAAAVLIHGETPPCPCRTYAAQQRAASCERMSRDSADNSSSNNSDDDSDEGEGNRGRAKSQHVSPDLSPTPPAPGNGAAAAVVVSASSASFPARLKDVVRAGSGPRLARTMTAASSRTSLSGNSDPPDVAQGSWSPFGSMSHAPRPLLTASTLLLPVTAAAPPRPYSALTATDDDDGNGDGGSSSTSHTPRPADAPPMTTSVPCRTGLTPVVRPIPVEVDTLPSRTLHPLWTHTAPEDIRRCALCSAQLLLQGSWHALYLLQLLTLLSAAPAMAAPLPLPPATVMKVQPVEAFLTLFQTAQRCLVAGLTLTAAVSVQRTAAPSAHPSTTDLSAVGQRVLDVLRGSARATESAGAASPPSASPPSVSTAAAGAEDDRRRLSVAAQQLSTEEGVVGEVARRMLAVVHVLGGEAAPQLWPLTAARRARRPRASAETADEAMSTPVSAPSVAEHRSLVELRGDVVALRCATFHAAFLLLMTHDGAEACIDVVQSLVEELQCQATHLREACGRAVQGSDGPPRQLHVSPSAEEKTELIYAHLVQVLEELRAGERGEDGSGIGSRPAANAAAMAAGGATECDDFTVLRDDLRALCCVVALLTVFASLVRGQESTNVDALGHPAATTTTTIISDAAAHLCDAHVHTTLAELQNSSRGSCSAQARQLLALWWLIRSEAVRQWARVATLPHSNNSAGKGVAPVTSIRVLDVEVTVSADVGNEPSPTTVQHWSAWLKEASRAAARASNAANEFLGLTLSPSSAVASLSSTAGGASSSSFPATAGLSLRWRLPEKEPGQPHRVQVACLPLAWVRMWLLLCPPLFHISPTDALTLRHTVQQQQQQQQEELRRKADAVATRSDEVQNMPLSPKHATPQQKASPQKGKGSPKPATKRTEATRGALKAAADRSSVVAGAAASRRTGTSKSNASAEKAKPSGAAAAAAAAAARGSSTADASITALAPAQAEAHLRRTEALHRRLQYSTEPVYFWTRWSHVFLTSSATPPRDAQRGREDESEPNKTAAVVSSPPSVSAIVSEAVAILRCPSLAWGAPLPSSQLTDALQCAFPLLTSADVVTALEVQARELLTSGAQASRAALPLPTRAHRLFPSYSFASFLAPVHDVVSAFHATLEAVVPADVAAGAAAVASPSSVGLSLSDTREANERKSSPQLPAPLVASPQSPPLPPVAASPPPSPSLPPKDDTAAVGEKERAGVLQAGLRPVPAAARRSPLVAARALPQRVTGGLKTTTTSPATRVNASAAAAEHRQVNKDGAVADAAVGKVCADEPVAGEGLTTPSPPPDADK